MKCYLLFFFLLVFSVFSSAQEVNRLKIDKSEGLMRISENVDRIYNPIFSQEGATLTADSADYNKEERVFDAFGHIVITQTEGTLIYADLLHYDANTRIAVLTNHVKMIDRDGVILTTDFFTYNMLTRVGRYLNGGKIDNKGDVLTSVRGYYFSESKDAYFGSNVVITTKDALVKSDTMRYNSASRIAYFYLPTNIYSKKDTFSTDLGTYNTETRQAFGYKNNLYRQSTKFLKGDTVAYDDLKGFGKAQGNVVFTDTGSQKIMLFGQRGFYDRADSSALLTVRPYVIFLTQDSSKVDSVIMTADSLYTRLIEKRFFKPVHLQTLSKDPEVPESEAVEVAAAPKRVAPKKATPAAPPKKESRKERKAREKAQKAAPPDSVRVADSINALAVNDLPKKLPRRIRPKTAAQLADSLVQDSIRQDSIKLSLDTTKTRVLSAYRHVRIFKNDLQSTSDSVFYSYTDSLIRSYGHPMVWSQGSQLSSDTLYMQMKDRKLHRMLLQRNGFIVSTEDSTLFNQVKGRVITGFFKDNKLQRMYVDGNAESIYFAKDSSNAVNVNRTQGSLLRITFVNNELGDIMGMRKTTGTASDISLVEEAKRKLKGFVWKPKDRPKSKNELIGEPEKKPVTAPKKPVTPKPKPKTKTPTKAPVKKKA